MNKIAIILARSGSKGLKDKNILMLRDKPVIAYTIEAALQSREFSRVIVSTDSLLYKTIAEKYGAEVILRDAQLSADQTPSFLVIEDIFHKLGEKVCDYFVLLQPTSPLRTETHIKNSISDFEKNYQQFDYCVSVSKATKSSCLVKTIEQDNSLKNFDADFTNYRRGDFEEYSPNGAIFIAKTREYLNKKSFFGVKSLAFYMDKESSVDIDDVIDFELVITLMNKRNHRKDSVKNVLARIEQKTNQGFFCEKKDITLIGHSILDGWNISTLAGKSVVNLGISGITTSEYNDYILSKNKVTHLGKMVFIMLGTNDIILKNWHYQDTVEEIRKMLAYLLTINPDAILYFIEVSRVFSRNDRNNQTIIQLNEYIKANLPDKITYLSLGEDFQDDFGNLKLDFTYDGLHFNDKGYKKLEALLTSLL